MSDEALAWLRQHGGFILYRNDTEEPRFIRCGCECESEPIPEAVYAAIVNAGICEDCGEAL